MFLRSGTHLFVNGQGWRLDCVKNKPCLPLTALHGGDAVASLLMALRSL